MPDSATIGCVAWNKADGWLCCGAEQGLVKVIHIGDGGDGKAKMSSFSLPGHSEKHKVTACCWNERYKKLTTGDDSGHIIVWLQNHLAFQEEMVNNRNCSVVTDMQWAPDGSRICIAYKDGAVIVGHVDGTRLWGKELDMPLDKLTWGPASQTILFATREGDVFVYDADGNQISKLDLQCQRERGPSIVAAISWCDAADDLLDASRQPPASRYVPGVCTAQHRYSSQFTSPIVCACRWRTGKPGLQCMCRYTGVDSTRASGGKHLAIALLNGMLQLTASQTDQHPVLVDTMVRIAHLAWNADGTILAVAGTSQAVTDGQDANVVRFFTNCGAFLHQMKLPRFKTLEGMCYELGTTESVLSCSSVRRHCCCCTAVMHPHATCISLATLYHDLECRHCLGWVQCVSGRRH
jgi:WD repeat-containing protein 35